MQQIITAKLKLVTTAEQFMLLRQTQLAFRDALNYVSRYAFEHGKLSSAQLLHKGAYRDIRSLFNLPSQMACSVMRQVSTTYKGLWMKLNKNIEHRRSGYTKRCFKGLDKPPKYLSPTLTYVNGHDYGFKPDQHVSVLTLHGRIAVRYQGYNRHVILIHHGAALGEAKLLYDKRHKQFYLLVSLKLEVQDPTHGIQRAAIGVDVGQRYLAVTSSRTESQFYSGKTVRAKAEHSARLQKRLRRKGTRGATKRLIAISGRERRFKLQTNHVIAKSIVTTHPHSLIGMESLTEIRERAGSSKRHIRKGKRIYPSSSPKQRRANRHASAWAFAELQEMIGYKAALTGSQAIMVDADYTSQRCPSVVTRTSRTDRMAGSSSPVRIIHARTACALVALIHSMLISSGPEILRCERFLSNRIG